MAASSRMLLLFLLLASSSSTAILASGGDDNGGLTHIHFYVHETFTEANATTLTVVASPLGGNSSFGLVQVFDLEVRIGRDRASKLIGRFQGLLVGTGLNGAAFHTSITVVFTAGEYRGSTLAVLGPVLGFTGGVERAVVGGTGKFRMASGYSLLKVLGRPTPETVLFEVDLFVLMHQGKY